MAKWQQAVAGTMSKAPLSALAEALQRDESVACRVRSGETKITFNEAMAILAALGFKAVQSDAICVNREKFSALATIAQAAMADEQTARRLIWEDEA